MLLNLPKKLLVIYFNRITLDHVFWIWIVYVEPLLAAPPVIEAVKPAEEVAGNFVLLGSFLNLY